MSIDIFDAIDVLFEEIDDTQVCALNACQIVEARRGEIITERSPSMLRSHASQAGSADTSQLLLLMRPLLHRPGALL